MKFVKKQPYKSLYNGWHTLKFRRGTFIMTKTVKSNLTIQATAGERTASANALTQSPKICNDEQLAAVQIVSDEAIGRWLAPAAITASTHP